LFTPFAGCGHVDEIFMLFRQHKLSFETVFTEEDKSTSRNLLKLWTDFAKTGDPTPDSKSTGVNWDR
jgi:hypothetical protein